MYLGGERLYYFAGENIVQKYPFLFQITNLSVSQIIQKLKQILRLCLLKVFLLMHECKVIEYTRPEMRETVKSVYFENPGKENLSKTIGKNEEKKKPKEPPRDLGEKFVKILLVSIAIE